MIRALSTFRTLLEALDALGKAKRSTDALLHRACAAFVAMVAETLKAKVEIRVDGFVIARTHEQGLAYPHGEGSFDTRSRVAASPCMARDAAEVGRRPKTKGSAAGRSNAAVLIGETPIAREK